MQIRVLGHFEASVDDRPVALGGAKQRAVLAMLGLEANRAVSADRLIEGLWGEEPPPSAAKMVQNYVWRLRKVLADDGGAEICTRGRGYELRIDPELVDVVRCERLMAEAGRAATAGRPPDAAREALRLFRGPPLADLSDEPFAAAEIRRLEELRETAAELAIDADLSAGRHQEVLGEIEGLLAKHPLRERLHAQRMLALYRCGRQAEALEAFREARRLLVDEIGVEPGADLRGLHEAVLRHDPSLELVPLELPRELDISTAPTLVGRDGEMARLNECWGRACAGRGELVAVSGGHGMGKTRLAGELAGEAHRAGATVLYATGWQPTQSIAQSLRGAREATRPTLLVVDDADASDTAMVALERAGHEITTGAALVLATVQGPEAMARLGCGASLELAPLEVDGVRRIALLYAPGEVPADELLRASGGVPGRVHELASAWARRRVAAVADRAATGRRELRSVEDELAVGLAALQVAREHADPPLDETATTVCPFKGLAAFESADAGYFFGRERLVAELVARLVGALLVWASLGRRGAASHHWWRPGCCPHWPPACCRAATRGRRSSSVPASIPSTRCTTHRQSFSAATTGCWSSISSRRCSPPVATTMNAMRSSMRSCACATSATPGVSSWPCQGRLLRPLRCLPRAGAAARRQSRPRGADAPRRTAPSDRAARPPRRTAASTPSSSMP